MGAPYPTFVDESGVPTAVRVDAANKGIGSLPGTLVTLLAGEDLTNNVLNTRTPMSYTNLSASALIKTGAGVVTGFIVNSHTSGTLKLWDNTSAATTVLLNTITFAAGSGIVVNLGAAVQYTTGLYATIGGTADITLFWK